MADRDTNPETRTYEPETRTYEPIHLLDRGYRRCDGQLATADDTTPFFEDVTCNQCIRGTR